jgi:electron transport complex protein RnfB
MYSNTFHHILKRVVLDRVALVIRLICDYPPASLHVHVLDRRRIFILEEHAFIAIPKFGSCPRCVIYNNSTIARACIQRTYSEADAIARGEAPINRCPPGGHQIINRLAACTRQPALPLDASRGAHKPPLAALIDEANCIGCTLCIQACPVDAIVGAQKVMHTVIAEYCTGCELCLPPCPVDCISLVPLAIDFTAAPAYPRGFDPDAARARHGERGQRLERVKIEQAARHAAKAESKLQALDAGKDGEDPAAARKRAIVAAALARARAKLAADDGERL